MYQCCSIVTQKPEEIYNHFIETHCNNFPHAKNLNALEIIRPLDNNNIVLEEGGMCDDLNEEIITTNSDLSFNIEEFIANYKARQKNNTGFNNDEDINNDILNSLDFQNIFSNNQELLCYLLVYYYGVSKEAYNFLKDILIPSWKKDIHLPHYDTLKKRKEWLVGGKVIEKDDYVYIGIKDVIIETLRDPVLFERMCLSREDFTKYQSTNQQTTSNQPTSNQEQLVDQEQTMNEQSKKEKPIILEPFTTRIFCNLVNNCPVKAFPLAILLYLDDFLKWRTKIKSTCASYFTFYNWKREFMNRLESIQTNGFSKSNVGFWEMSKQLSKEIDELQGSILTIINPITQEPIDLQLNFIAYLWDTPQRMKCLSLMKDECSKCLQVFQNQHLTPNFTLGASLDSNSHQFQPRDVKVMRETLLNISSVTLLTTNQPNRNDFFGLKLFLKEEEFLKDQRISKSKRNQLLSGKTLTPIISPFVTSKQDWFKQSPVDFFHEHIQGLSRTHLKYLLSKLNYTNPIDDLIISIKNKDFPSSSPLFMKDNIDHLSGTEMSHFFINSSPYIYKLVFINENVNLSNELKSKIYECWILHLKIVTKLLEYYGNILELDKCEILQVRFHMLFVDIYGTNNCQFPNNHWKFHIFQDCKLYGNVKWFWTLLFELKHSIFKKFNDRSNKKNVEKRGLEMDFSLKRILSLFPKHRSLIHKHTSSKQTLTGTVLFRHDKNDLRIGIMGESINDSCVMRSIMKVHCECQVLHMLQLENLNCNNIVKKDDLICNCIVVSINNHYYLNQYCLYINIDC